MIDGPALRRATIVLFVVVLSLACRRDPGPSGRAAASASSSHAGVAPATPPVAPSGCAPARSGGVAPRPPAATYPRLFPSLPADAVATREATFRERNPGGWKFVGLDPQGYLRSLTARDACLAPLDPLAMDRLTDADVARFSELVARNADLFGITDLSTLKWEVVPPRPGLVPAMEANQTVSGARIATIRVSKSSTGPSTPPELGVTGHFWPVASVPEATAKARDAVVAWKSALVGTSCEVFLAGSWMACDPVMSPDGKGTGCEGPRGDPPRVEQRVLRAADLGAKEGLELLDGPEGKSLRRLFTLSAGDCRSLSGAMDAVTGERLAAR